MIDVPKTRPLAAFLVFLLATATAAAGASLRAVPVPETSITTLLFHQISATPVETAGGADQVQRPWVTPAEFDAILREAEAQGFHYVTLDQALAFFEGRAPGSSLPGKPLLVTFDDGYRTAWTSGTPLLRKHHATATMFFEGILTGTKPERLTIPELLEMKSSGVWTLQSHGWMGHSNIVVDANGTKNPYWYANLMYLPEQHRLETHAEFEERIRADLHHFKQAFEPKLGPIVSFAYPSGEFGQNSALLKGGDPKAKLEAGHSNAADLTPLLFDALRKEGYATAFAVSIPGVAHPASLENSLYALPRVGVGADFKIAAIDILQISGAELPEISHDVFDDPGPIAAAGDGVYVASTVLPQIFKLDAHGRVTNAYYVDALLDDRHGNPSLISALIPLSDGVEVIQQAGWWAGAAPKLTRLRLTSSGAEVVESKVLPNGLSWLVGVTPFKSTQIGMTDDGHLFDVTTAKPIATVQLPDPADREKRQNRFAGPVVIADRLVVYDRTRRMLLQIDDGGKATPIFALTGDVRNLAAAGAVLLTVDWSDDRHVLQRYDVVPTT